jgi:hypothetical protein
VSKRLASRYSSGPSRNWIKTKCPNWKRINAERHKLFEGPRKPEQTEAQKTLAKKRQELARVLERLRAPGLSAGMARELRKQQAILKREIVELGSHLCRDGTPGTCRRPTSRLAARPCCRHLAQRR